MMNNQVIKIYQYVYYKYLNEEKKRSPGMEPESINWNKAFFILSLYI